MKISAFFRSLAAFAAIAVLAPAALAGGGGGIPGAANSMGPIEMRGVSLGNFGVVDGHIYRGAKPDKREYGELAAIGVTTVIDLRGEAKSSDRQSAEAAGLHYVCIPMKDHGTPSDEEAAAFLRAIDAAGSDKVYVHCAGGRHRTGSMIAVYRMAKNGWSLDRAYDEMLKYDFYTSNGHGGYKTYVEDFARRMASDASSVPGSSPAPAASTVADAAAN